MGDRGVFGGGLTTGASDTNVIDYVTISSTGNATDFGDMTVARNGFGGTSNGINDRCIFSGGSVIGEPPAKNIIDYITINSAGNATDFGDLTAARLSLSSTSNNTNERGIHSGGYIGASPLNIIDYVTINSAGNATDFGDLLSSVGFTGSTSNATLERGIIAGGGITNVIQYVTINSAGNATDFGDLSSVWNSFGSTSNLGYNRGIFGGGNLSGLDTNRIEYITINVLGNSIDFGDLTVARNESPGSTSNGSSQRGVFAGGDRLGPGASNIIDYITINSPANAIDFGDLTVVRSFLAGASNGPSAIYVTGTAVKWQAGVSISNMQYMMSIDRGNDTTSSIIYSLEAGGMLIPVFVPTPPSLGDRGVFWTNLGDYSYVTISTTADAADFGDNYWITTRQATYSNGGNERGIKACFYGTEYITINSLGNGTDYGDANPLRWGMGGSSNGTNERGVQGGGSDSIDSYTKYIDYITINSSGNGTTFGDLYIGKNRRGGASNLTNERAVWFGGWTSVNNIDYVTINSTGNAADFGDCIGTGFVTGGTSNGTNERGISWCRYNGAYRDTIDYITINSTGNATDFGDNSQTNGYNGCLSNATNERGLSGGGVSSRTIIEYITISTIGNSATFGDLVVGGQAGGCSNT